MGSRVTGREPDGLAELLRREAAGERPIFSAALHERILRGMPVKPATAAVVQRAEPLGEGVGRSAWRQVSVAGAAAALMVALVIVGAGPDPADGPPQRVASVAADPAGGSGAAAAVDAAELGIERVPMFDEFEAGVRDGVITLAATLLDVPEWRMVADFDAAGFFGEDSAR